MKRALLTSATLLSPFVVSWIETKNPVNLYIIGALLIVFFGVTFIDLLRQKAMIIIDTGFNFLARNFELKIQLWHILVLVLIFASVTWRTYRAASSSLKDTSLGGDSLKFDVIESKIIKGPNESVVRPSKPSSWEKEYSEWKQNPNAQDFTSNPDSLFGSKHLLSSGGLREDWRGTVYLEGGSIFYIVGRAPHPVSDQLIYCGFNSPTIFMVTESYRTRIRRYWKVKKSWRNDGEFVGVSSDDENSWFLSLEPYEWKDPFAIPTNN